MFNEDSASVEGTERQFLDGGFWSIKLGGGQEGKGTDFFSENSRFHLKTL